MIILPSDAIPTKLVSPIGRSSFALIQKLGPEMTLRTYKHGGMILELALQKQDGEKVEIGKVPNADTAVTKASVLIRGILEAGETLVANPKDRKNRKDINKNSPEAQDLMRRQNFW